MSNASSNALQVIARRSDREDPTLPVILEYQWPSTAIVNAPIPRSAQRLVWVISSLVLAMIAPLGMIPVDRVVTTRGVVVNKSATMFVQPLQTAIVHSIDVHEGETVKAGQVLAQLDPTFAAADLATLQQQASSLNAEVARLQAEADSKPFDYSGSDPQWNLQASIFKQRKAAFDSKVANYAAKLSEIGATIASAQADAATYSHRLDIAQQIEGMHKKLEADQWGSRLDSLKAENDAAAMQSSMEDAQHRADGATHNQTALAAERDSYIQGWYADVAQQLSDAKNKAKDTQEQLNKAQLRRQLIELRAGADGVVQSIAKVSEGSVLQSGARLITLVPKDAQLEIETNIAGQEDGFVRINDPVSIKFDTFPFSRFGMADGTVRIISPSSFTQQEEERNPTSALSVPQTSEPFYRARIAIDRLALHNLPENFHIIPGMPVTADIKVGKRTLLQYFLGIVTPAVHEGMREP
jgi:HlyD family secretion protein